MDYSKEAGKLRNTVIEPTYDLLVEAREYLDEKAANIISEAMVSLMLLGLCLGRIERSERLMLEDINTLDEWIRAKIESRDKEKY